MSSPSPHRSSRATTGPSVWLYGPSRDLLFGYGLAYLLSVPILLEIAALPDAGTVLLWTITLAALAISTPHYGATLLRVYENRRERRKYAVFTVWAAFVLIGLFVAGLFSPLVGSILLTAYAGWGIWHFSGQNYGIAVMALRRLGIEVDAELRRPLYVSFIASAALAILSVHIAGSQLSFAAGSHDPTGTFRILQIGLPAALQGVLDGAVILAYVGSIALFGIRVRRHVSLRRLSPLLLLLLTQALWFTVPAVGTLTGAWGSGSAGYPFAAVWISVAHAAQYLWVTTYYAGRSAGALRLPSYWTKCLLAGAAVTAPGLLFAPGLLGNWTAHSAGISVLVFSVVNLHHFLIDGAIWKLREDGPVARVLIRNERAASPAASVASGLPWGRVLVYAIGAVVVVQQGYGVWLSRLISSESASPTLRFAAARDLRGLGLETPDAWVQVARSAEAGARPTLAIAAYRSALEIQEHVPAPEIASRLAWLLVNERGHDPRSVREATQLARSAAVAFANEHFEGLEALAAAHAAGGDWQRAEDAAAFARRIARDRGNETAISRLDHAVSAYRQRAGGGAPAP